MKTLIIVLTTLMLFGLVTALDISDLTKEVQNSQVQITITKYYDIKIQKEIIPQLNETIGRTYSIGINHTQNGIFVNGNGAIITGADSDEETYIKEAVDKVEENIVGDIATIEHIKKYGENITEKEKLDYLLYFRSNFGRMYDKYRNTSLNITKGAEARVVKLPNQNETFAKLIKKDNDSQIIQMSAADVPSLKIIGNTTHQRGDEVYIIGKNSSEPTKTALISNDLNNTITLDKPIESGQIVIDKYGNVVGIGRTDGAKELVRADSMLNKLQSANITNSKSALSTKYTDAVANLNNGEYQKALDTFNELAKTYPTEQVLQYQLVAKEKANEFMQAIKNPIYWLVAIVAVCIGFFGVKYMTRPKHTGRARGRYTPVDEEEDYSK